MNIILEQMLRKGEQMMADLERVQDFDFDNATEEEIDKLSEFLQNKIVDAEKTQAEVKKVQENLKEQK